MGTADAGESTQNLFQHLKSSFKSSRTGGHIRRLGRTVCGRSDKGGRNSAVLPRYQKAHAFISLDEKNIFCLAIDIETDGTVVKDALMPHKVIMDGAEA